MKFLIVDDHPLLREALASVLLELRPGCSVFAAATLADAMRLLQTEAAIDLVLLDVRLPDGSGLARLPEIVRTCISAAVVVLSGDLDRTTVQQALSAGAAGCIPKTESREVLTSALALVLSGGVYVPPLALPAMTRPSVAAPVTAPLTGSATTPAALGLTGRQLDVLSLLMQGKNNKLICRALDLAEPTVKHHISAILRALGVDSRTEAVLAVTRMGWQLPEALPRTDTVTGIPTPTHAPQPR